jgi:hypothetical protein
MKDTSAFWRLIYWFSGIGEPWKPSDDNTIDVNRPAVRTMIARARLEERRGRASIVCWTYSRDRVVERRELRCESAEQKQRRLMQARFDRAQAERRKIA